MKLYLPALRSFEDNQSSAGFLGNNLSLLILDNLLIDLPLHDHFYGLDMGEIVLQSFSDVFGGGSKTNKVNI